MKFLLLGSASALLEAPRCEKKPFVASTQGCAKFQEFEAKFNKQYASEEERARRYWVFLENFVDLERMEKTYGAKYSYLTPLFDWTKEEYQSRNSLKTDFDRPAEKELKMENFPKNDDEAFDWRDNGFITPAKDQGQCGSCWSFATVCNIEGTFYNQHKKLWSLSEEEMISCDHVDKGCNGGLPANAARWLIDSGKGLEEETAYPYHARVEMCETDTSKYKVFVHDFGWIPAGREDAMTQFLVVFGPLSIGVNADPLMSYMGGIIAPKTKDDCSPLGIDHAVTVVAYGTEDGTPFWTIRNSWSPNWGEDGHFRIIRGSGACGLDQMATTVTKTSGKEAMLQM